jgi:hypothetical protein
MITEPQTKKLPTANHNRKGKGSPGGDKKQDKNRVKKCTNKQYAVVTGKM